MVYAEALGPPAYVIKARVQLLRDLGSAVAPFNAFLIAQGLETLSLRIERHVQNAQAVAEWLEARDEVESVNYAGPAELAVVRARPEVRAQGRRRGAGVRARGRRRGGQGVRRRARAAQPRRQHRRRALAGDPPGVDDALAS